MNDNYNHWYHENHDPWLKRFARSSRPRAPWGSPWCSNPRRSLRRAPRRRLRKTPQRTGGGREVTHGEKRWLNRDLSEKNEDLRGFKWEKCWHLSQIPQQKRGFNLGKYGFDRRWIQFQTRHVRIWNMVVERSTVI